MFSEHPDNSKKILFSNFLHSFLFFVIFVVNFFVQKVSFTIFPLKKFNSCNFLRLPQKLIIFNMTSTRVFSSLNKLPQWP